MNERPNRPKPELSEDLKEALRSHDRTWQQWVLLALVASALVLAGVLVVQNLDVVAVDVLFLTVRLPLILLAVFFFAAGVAAAVLVGRRRRARAAEAKSAHPADAYAGREGA